jgi:heme O synthase-like polyprenyltransferase
MKSSADGLISTASAQKNLAAVFADLVKARLTALVLLTTFVGFYLGERGTVNFLLMFHAMFGTALVASGAAALNQFL